VTEGREVVFVTGAGGLIGHPLCERLSEKYAVLGLDREGPPHPPPSVQWVAVDLASDESVRRALAEARAKHGSRVASVVHLAAYYDFSGAPSPLYREVTVRGTERLLEGLRDFEVGQFIFSSTMLVHAPRAPGERIDEDSPLDPKWPYPASKVETESLLLARRGKIPLVLLRIAGVYQDGGGSLPLSRQLQRLYEKSVTAGLFPGDPSHGQSFVHLDDVLEAIERAVDRRRSLPPVTTLLIGEPETLAYDEIQRAFARSLHGEEWRTRRIPKALAKAGARVTGDDFIKPWMIDRADDHYALDVSRARRLLEWNPRHRLRDALPGMAEALKRDPEAWYRRYKIKRPGAAAGTA
jgi:nucleoside-diphosphate-sugar epimerase